HCHCKDCQKITGSGKATIVFVPTKKLEINNDYKVFSVIGHDGTNVHRGFCPECGSPVISYVTEQPHLRFIKAGSLDNSSWLEVESSFWSVSACKWDPINSSVPSFEKNPT
ncbi:MAG: GFA family protein, partial [Pseudomonadota bacterium]|nr:GFA family protein [Pseudomonadota bacterium]